jgi:hypothetical protein
MNPDIGMDESHPLYQAIDRGGGQTCDIPGVIRELAAAGYVIVPREPTDAMCAAMAKYYHDNYREGHEREDTSAVDIWRDMIGAAFNEKTDA